MTANSTQRLWEHASPLTNAWIEFATEEKRLLFDAIPDPMSEFARIAELSPGGGFGALAKAGMTGLQAKSRRDGMIGEMREHLLKSLFNGKLVAAGFRLRPSKSARPVIIDAALFEAAEIGWINSTVEWVGLSYVKVRIFDPRNRENADVEKGSRAAIDAAISELKLADLEFCNLPRKSACNLVREKIGVTEIKGNGLTNQNISKRILEQCPKRKIEF